MKWSNDARWICRVMMCLMAAFVLAAFAAVPSAQADGVTVTIQSFMRPGVSDNGTIRNSELMEAVVTGYSGNLNNLIYEWKNVNCSADLYLFNSYNMAGIDDTDGEIEEIKKGNSAGGMGFAWASMRSRNANDWNGTITVTVKDPDGNVLASDSYKDFLEPDLGEDMDGIAFGLFIGEKVNVKDLLGRSAILHVSCRGASVSNGRIGNSSIARLTQEGDYFVTGVSKGYTEATITVSKNMCSFHSGDKATVTTPVYVFQQPTTSTTTTTLTLHDLDDNCDYFIGSMVGQRVNDTVVFTGLTPNTEYQVTVRGRYQDGNVVKYAYAYVRDTTKPVYTAAVNTWLDGELTNINDIHSGTTALYLKDMDNNDSADYIPLTNTATGVYTAGLENGRYYIYHFENGNYIRENNAFLQIHNHSAQADLHHYSVTYDANGGSFAQNEDPGKMIYPAGAAVTVAEAVPQREGYSFTGWAYGGKTYQPEAALVSSISSAITLTAQWDKAVTVTVHVTMDHVGGSGYDQTAGKADLEVYLLEKLPGSALLETGDALYFAPEGVTNEDGDTMPYTYSATYQEGETQKNLEHAQTTTYTATAATYANRSESSVFDVKVQKSSYDASVESTKDDDGNWLIEVKLVFNPTNFDLEFAAHMHKDVPADLWPDAVIYKVAFWAADRNAWEIITQMEGDKGGVRVDINPTTGSGSGSYPVWKHEKDNVPYGYRVVVTGFVYDDHTITVPANAAQTTTSYTDGNYTATMSVTGGQNYGGLAGAYHDGTQQQGELDAEITVEAYKVTFDAMGGTINGQNSLVEGNQYRIPDLDDYVPSMEGHTFLGWWYVDEDYNYSELVTEGELLTEDVYLYARWDHILTGHVIVEGTYEQDGQTVSIWERDLAESVDVILQEIVGDSVLNVASAELEVLAWDEETGIGTTEEYEFTGLSPEKNYRVVFEVMNYTATYQNATSGAAFNETDYTAVYEDNAVETFVNGRMKFVPVSYEQPVTVDATEIGETFRPLSVLAQIFYREVSSSDDWDIISQHTVAPEGIPMTMGSDGWPVGSYSESVWESVWDGALYEYQVNVALLDDEDPSDWPVTIHYSSASRWSPSNNAPTATLKATLVPNDYAIIYHLNDGTDAQETGVHTWSFESQLDYVPERDGYIFDGWYDSADNKVTSIPASTHEDVEVYAKWTVRGDLQLTVNHVDADTNDLLASENLQVTFGDEYTAEKLKKTIDGYTYSGSEPESVIITTGTNEMTLKYTRNTYAYVVRYLDAADTTTELLPAKTASDQYGTEITETAETIPGYTVNTASQTVTLEEDGQEIIFLYSRRDDLSYQVNYLDEETQEPVYTAKLVSEQTYQDEVLTENEIIAIDGYTCVGADKEKLIIDADVSQNVINLYYAADNLRDSDQTADLTDKDSLSGGDSVPDKYQKKITFKVLNGVWEDGTADAILEIVTLFKDGKWDVQGTASLTAPAGMVAQEGYLQASGAWDVEVPTTVLGTADETYTYTFQRSLTPVEPGDTVSYIVEHYKADDNGEYPATPTETEILASQIGSTVTAAPKEYDDYCLNTQVSVLSGVLVKIEDDSDILVLQLFYDKDGEYPDDIPDKYQKKITFNVVNGTWEDGTAAAIVEIVTLLKDGKWDVQGTASLTVPAGMVAQEGYLQASGAWDVEVPTTVLGTADETYTYTFQRSLTPVEPGDTVSYIVEHYKADDNDVYPVNPTETEILASQIGSTVTAVPKAYDGYCLNAQVSVLSGVLVKIEDDSDILVLQLFYNKDSKHPDDIPDKYQKKITFKVFNGTWEDGSTKDIVVYVTLMKDGKYDPDGSASLPVPGGMKPLANFTGGRWDITPPSVVSGLNDEVYTYMYLYQVNVPQTGDPTNPMLWLALMGGSFLLFVLCVFKPKSNNWGV